MFSRKIFYWRPVPPSGKWLTATGFSVAGLIVGGIIGSSASAQNSYAPPTIQGVLPPPGYTTYISDTGARCDLPAAGAAAAANLSNGSNNPGQAGAAATNSLGSCLSGLANMAIPGIPSFNMAGLMSMLQTQACAMAQGAVMNVTAPLASKMGGGVFNTQGAASQLGIRGTGINMGSAITTTPVTTQQLNGAGAAGASIFRSAP